MEDEDESLIQTSLRETEEEIGINRNDVHVIGQLSELFIPPSNFNVHTVIGYYNGVPNFKLDSQEVANIIEISVEELLNKNNITEKKILTHSNQEVSIPCYFIQNEIIWGATAMITAELMSLIKRFL